MEDRSLKFFILIILLALFLSMSRNSPRIETPLLNDNELWYDFTATTGVFQTNRCVDWVDVDLNICREYIPITTTHEELKQRGYIAVPSKDILK